MKVLRRICVLLVFVFALVGCAGFGLGGAPQPPCETGIAGRTVTLSAPRDVWGLAAQRVTEWLGGTVIVGHDVKTDFTVVVNMAYGRAEYYSATEVYQTPYRDRRGRIRERTRIETYSSSPDVGYSVSVEVFEGRVFRCAARGAQSAMGSPENTKRLALENALWKLR